MAELLKHAFISDKDWTEELLAEFIFFKTYRLNGYQMNYCAEYK